MVERLKLTGGKDWRGVLARAGITYLENAQQIRDAMAKHKLLLTSRCSKTKTKQTGTPKQFYVSPQNLAFYQWCERHGLRYGILSDMYGLHMDNVVKEYYDVHPSKLTDAQFAEMAKLINAELDKHGYEGVIYFNSSPVMSVPYFYMLALAGVKTYYITKLHNLKQTTSFF